MRIKTISCLFAVMLLVLGSVTAQAQGVRWEDLSRAQRSLLEDQADAWSQLEPVRQERIALGAERWIRMNRSERRAAQGRFTRWRDEFNDQQRSDVRRRYEIYRGLPTVDRNRIRDAYRDFNRLPLDRRNTLRRQFRDLSPDQRQRVRDRRVRPTDRR